MFKFRVEPDGREPYEAEAKSRDVVRWEGLPGRPGGRYIGQLEKSPSMTALAELAWCASRRLGLTDLPLKEFLTSVDVSTIEDPEAEEDDGEESNLDPTLPAA